jgi:hypothetical protein
MQVQVSTFASKVPVEYRSNFMELMREWDGNPSVRYAFYDIDLLTKKLQEAKEMI